MSVVLIIVTFMWDTTFDQEVIPTYKLIGWFISGILIYSIIKNAYKITGWFPFKDLTIALHNKIENETGVNLEEETK